MKHVLLAGVRGFYPYVLGEQAEPLIPSVIHALRLVLLTSYTIAGMRYRLFCRTGPGR
jgi:hypothetical protein